MHAKDAPRKPASVSGTAGHLCDCLLAAIDMLDLGIMLIDRSERIIFANRAAETLLDLSGPDTGDPSADQPRAGGTLDPRIRAALRDKKGRTERGVAMLSLESRSLFLLRVCCGAPEEAADILFVSESSGQSLQDLSPVASHYGLTRAELRLLQALVRGDKLSRYAERAGITLNTAKGYLKQLFRKTTVTRQSDLVRLVLGNPILRLVLPDAARG